RDVGGDRLELAADLDGGRRFEIEHVLRGGAAVQVEQEDILRLARPRRHGTVLLQGEEAGQVERAAQDRQGAGREGLAPGDAVAEPARVAEHPQHGTLPRLVSLSRRASAPHAWTDTVILPGSGRGPQGSVPKGRAAE